MRIVLTGGGTAGHVIPNVAVIEELRKRGENEILYIGSTDGPERKIIEALGVRYRAISCGKLRRYFDWKNFTDGFRIIRGISQAKKILAEFKPDVVFSKGGFVSFPVSYAAARLKVRNVIHESDYSPGLANRMAMRFADKICVSFEESVELLKKHKNKVVVTGSPIRKDILNGSSEAGYHLTKLNNYRPVILAMGGSQGALQINSLVRESLDEILKRFQVVHITGRGNLDIGIKKDGYVQFEYLGAEMKDVYAISEVVVSRGGANSLFEIGALQKKAIIIPLSTDGSRGDQVENARIFTRKFGWSMLAGQVTARDFVEAVELTLRNNVNTEAMVVDGSSKIVDLILAQ